MTAPTKQDRDRMGERLFDSASGKKSLDRASLHILGPRTEGQRKVKPVKEQGPPCLSGVQSFGGFQILQILVISPHEKQLLRSLKPMYPFLQRDLYGQ